MGIDPQAGEPAEHVLVVCRDAAQAALDHWQRHKWRMGEADCVRMIASHLRLLRYKVKLPPAGSYRTVKAALRKLDEFGYASIPDALDQLGLERIVPARTRVGDILQLPSEDERLPALTIALGNGRVVGWHGDAPAGATVLQPVEFVNAWRVEPQP